MAIPWIKYFLRGLVFFIVSFIVSIMIDFGTLLQTGLIGANILILIWIPIIIVIYGFLITWITRTI